VHKLNAHAFELCVIALALVSFGRIDYLPGARRPWVVDLRKSKPVGRGASLYQAVMGNLRGRNV